MAWLTTLAIGARILFAYEMTPGEAVAPPQEWPVAATLELASGQPTLVMFAHPRCPCTSASIGEMAVLMARFRGLVSSHVIFITPEGSPDQWRATGLWKEAATIPGVMVHNDSGGRIARRFGVVTSGHTLLYRPDGTRLFSGGLTAARGHAGDNAGRAGLTSLLCGETPPTPRTPVYGCSLFECAIAATTKKTRYDLP